MKCCSKGRRGSMKGTNSGRPSSSQSNKTHGSIGKGKGKNRRKDTPFSDSSSNIVEPPAVIVSRSRAASPPHPSTVSIGAVAGADTGNGHNMNAKNGHGHGSKNARGHASKNTQKSPTEHKQDNGNKEYQKQNQNQNQKPRLLQTIVRSSKRRLSSFRSRSTYIHAHENVKTGVLNSSNNKNHNNPMNKGVVGLSNLGNTCFMNSSLQCLSNTIPLTDYFLGVQYKNEINHNNVLGTDGKLAEAYASLMREMWIGNERVVSPINFKSNLQSFASQFVGTRQQDAQEVLACLLDGIHEDLNRVEKKPYNEDVEGNGTNDEADSIQAWHNYLLRDKSVIVDIFQGQLRNTLTCKKCSHRSVKFDPFMYLSIPITEDQKSGVTLDDCLELFCREEELTNENQWYCPRCKEHVDAIKKFDLWTLPPVLIVHLKRFKHVTTTHHNDGLYSSWMSRGGSTNKTRVIKLNQKIDFPFRDWKPSTARNANDPSYDLYAVSNHLGNGYGMGHYTSYAMNRIDDKWYEFNDTRTTSIQEQQIGRNNDAAYLLFYNQTEKSNNAYYNRKPGTLYSNTSRSEESSSMSLKAWSNRVPIIYKQSISRPENWPHRQRDYDDDNDNSSYREFKRPPTGHSMIKGSASSDGMINFDTFSDELKL